MRKAVRGREVYIIASNEKLISRSIPARYRKKRGTIVDIDHYADGKCAYRIRLAGETGTGFWMPRKYFRVINDNIQEHCLRLAATGRRNMEHVFGR